MLKLFMSLGEFEEFKNKCTREMAPAHVKNQSDEQLLKDTNYPCLVETAFWDDPNGPYTYDHTYYSFEQIGITDLCSYCYKYKKPCSCQRDD